MHAGEQPQIDLLADWRFSARPARRWRPRRAPKGAGQALGLFARELRLVFIVLLVLFVTSETWQVFGRLSGVRYAVLFGLLVVAAGVLGALNARQQAVAAIADPRFERPVPRAAGATLARRLLGRVWFEILVVGLAVCACLFVLGVLVVDAALLDVWVRDNPAARVLELGSSGLVVSEPLARLVGVLGAVAALLFALEVLVDRDLRTDVTNDLLHDWESARVLWEQRGPPASSYGDHVSGGSCRQVSASHRRQRRLAQVRRGRWSSLAPYLQTWDHGSGHGLLPLRTRGWPDAKAHHAYATHPRIVRAE